MGSLESAVMRVLWSSTEAQSATDVASALASAHPVAYTTVMTVLERLRDKGLVRRNKEGRAFRYLPALNADDYVTGLIDEALGEASDRTATLLHFAGTLSKDEARALRSALDATENRSG